MRGTATLALLENLCLRRDFLSHAGDCVMIGSHHDRDFNAAGLRRGGKRMFK